MRKNLILLFALFLLGPSLVFSDVVSIKVAYFVPRANSDLWKIEFDQMDFTKTNFHGTSLGFSYEYFFTKEISLLLGIDTYSRKKMGVYNEYVGETIEGEDWAFDYGEGFAISHVFDVSITPIQVSLKLTPLGRRTRVIPYLGGGAGIYLWTVRLYGNMIDFSIEEIFFDLTINEEVIGNPIFATDAREENKISFGFHAFGGFMFPVGNRLSIDAEFKYNFVRGGSFTEGFEGFEPFDLSGYQISVGVSYWF